MEHREYDSVSVFFSVVALGLMALICLVLLVTA